MWMNLPIEIRIKILSYLSLTELLLKVAPVSKSNYQIVKDTSSLWKTIDICAYTVLNEANLKSLFNHVVYRCFKIPYADITASVPMLDCILGMNLLKCTHLTSLDLTGWPISTLFFLTKLEYLKYLNLADCKFLHDADFIAIAYCKKLETLDLGLTSISTDLLLHVTSHLPKLTVLDCARTYWTLPELDALMHNCPDMTLVSFTLRQSESMADYDRIVEKYNQCSFWIV